MASRRQRCNTKTGLLHKMTAERSVSISKTCTATGGWIRKPRMDPVPRSEHTASTARGRNKSFFVSVGRCEEDRRPSGLNNGVACYVSEERGAGETCTCNKFGCPKDGVRVFFRKCGTLQGVQMQDCHHFAQHMDRARRSHGTQTAKKMSSGTYGNQCVSPVNTISRVHFKVLTDRKVRAVPRTDITVLTGLYTDVNTTGYWWGFPATAPTIQTLVKPVTKKPW